MSNNEIQYLMQSLAEIHNKFQQNNYQLSSLDHHTLKNLLEQLHAKLLVQTEYQQTLVQSKVIPQTKVEPNNLPPVFNQSPTENSSNTVESINNEIDEVFSPAPTEEVHTSPQSHFQLGINERIMFAKELFNDDVSELQESIRKLKSFESKDEALSFFNKQLMPYLIDEGKDEEVVHEFEQIIHRIY